MNDITIPAELMTQVADDSDRASFIEDCEQLLREVGLEYLDPLWGDRLHWSDATYMDGCRGPLCSAAHRIASRKRTGAEPSAWWSEMEPVLQHIGEQFKIGREERIAELKRLYSATTKIIVPTEWPLLEWQKAL